MAGPIQCNNCGAVLADEDPFCGECGAPQHQSPEAGGQPLGQEPAFAPSPSVAPPAPLARPRASAEAGWRVAFIVVVVLGAIACCAGLSAFLLAGSTGSDTATTAENWLYSALCCLAPIGGTGVILVSAGAIIWYTRLRKS